MSQLFDFSCFVFLPSLLLLLLPCQDIPFSSSLFRHTPVIIIIIIPTTPTHAFSLLRRIFGAFPSHPFVRDTRGLALQLCCCCCCCRRRYCCCCFVGVFDSNPYGWPTSAEFHGRERFTFRRSCSGRHIFCTYIFIFKCIFFLGDPHVGRLIKHRPFLANGVWLMVIQ